MGTARGLVGTPGLGLGAGTCFTGLAAWWLRAMGEQSKRQCTQLNCKYELTKELNMNTH